MKKNHIVVFFILKIKTSLIAVSDVLPCYFAIIV